ncbi:hypothetical protein HMPREF3098_08875 [Corynebacterium sp. HMSC28B08]|nr:hypothetical protein HMPREF3098_08875 [Corynebacterium sp. HMSC28B08]
MKLNFLYIIAGLLLSLVAVYFISHGSDGVLIIPVLLAAGCFSAYLVGKRTYGSSSVKHIILPLFPFAIATVIGSFAWKLLMG